MPFLGRPCPRPLSLPWGKRKFKMYIKFIYQMVLDNNNDVVYDPFLMSWLHILLVSTFICWEINWKYFDCKMPVLAKPVSDQPSNTIVIYTEVMRCVWYKNIFMLRLEASIPSLVGLPVCRSVLKKTPSCDWLKKLRPGWRQVVSANSWTCVWSLYRFVQLVP